MRLHNRKIVLFGAGKIGRSFIAPLFSLGRYEVVFVDINLNLIDALNSRNSYQVVIKDEQDHTLQIEGVRGVFAEDAEQVKEEIATADILAVSVGAGALAALAPVLASGLDKRNRESGKPIDIIIAENMRDGAGYMKALLTAHLPERFPFDAKVGLVESSIGKMVPIMPDAAIKEDILQVFAEPYNTLILDREGFLNPVPDIAGISPKENMKAWVDRKLFIHNLGHVSAAYFGHYHYPDLVYIFEILEYQEVYNFTWQVMVQSADILRAQYPGVFKERDLREHIEDLIARFRNRSLGDTIFRVGCDLQRKLGADDRLMAPLKCGIKHKLPVDKIAEAIGYGIHFRGRDEHGKLLERDAEFHKMVQKIGTAEVLAGIGNLSRSDLDLLNILK
jgi:mannitol-1-phosphate 5-dehydrogenase